MRNAIVLGSSVTAVLVAIATACTGSDPDAPPVININVDGGSSGAGGTSGGRAGTSSGSSGDSGVYTGPCNPDAGFEDVQPLDELHEDKHYEGTAALTPDERAIYFVQTEDHESASGFVVANLVRATRDDWTKPFGAQLQGVPRSGPELQEPGYPAISADEKRLAYTDLGPSGDGSHWRVWYAEREATGDVWKPKAYAFDAKLESFGTKINADGVYFKGTSDNRKTWKPYRAPFAGDGGLGSPVVVKIERTEEIGDFVVFDEGRRAYFDSNTSDDSAYDIFMVTRDDTTKDEWAKPTRVTELSGPTDEKVAGVSPDGCRIYFTRDIAENQPKLFVARKPPL